MNSGFDQLKAKLLKILGSGKAIINFVQTTVLRILIDSHGKSYMFHFPYKASKNFRIKQLLSYFLLILKVSKPLAADSENIITFRY